RYLLVDEYQDTNACQYHLVRLLVGARGGLSVVGDDDQSIYAWRGAQPENLALLARDFPGLEVIKLEENYRSMGRILHAANALVANNTHLYEKRLWCRLGPGEPLRAMECRNGEHEAERVVSQLLAHRVRHNNQYRDYAILYRGNHQSRPFERRLREHRIPYHLSGGTSFFERTEIKDLMAYLRLLVNPDDDAAFLRAANTPRRGIGPGTMERLTGFARARGQSLMDACLDEALGKELSVRASSNLSRFACWLVDAGDRAQRGDALAVIGELVKEIDYEGWLRDQGPDPQSAERRLENVRELIGWVGRLLARGDKEATLGGALAQMALLDGLEREDDDTGDAVHLMTLHAAKGLEFDYVYLAGMEEELLPHRNSIEESLEEERRLCYVGITRARKGLTFSFAAQRRRYGEMRSCEPSRFLGELPQNDLTWEGRAPGDPEERKAQGRAHLAHLRNMLAEPE
ncbi:MAG: UvrD-helicase domain-containing protein, partial [Gammaproteobacteria bacterium]|nr:UvrD-helicase domain-containing protein [Gammaproteobacteria bacterium]NIR97514.1 UvrD-helicase domain-containing protein [Gammaproteobacteria bacterium]NIT63152.1 UvrD-helicase domain-containing protein [Gammaproteobacteria bacterium]NIV19271.1 UvrD-helicase domain-containing protein [Gammaproteobacteria bacterium]NIX10261.1 UvrD-helicase domain-containing protein [Gammaproteobacteria bacterium]